MTSIHPKLLDADAFGGGSGCNRDEGPMEGVLLSQPTGDQKTDVSDSSDEDGMEGNGSYREYTGSIRGSGANLLVQHAMR